MKSLIFLLMTEDKAQTERLTKEIQLGASASTVESVNSFREVIERILSGGVDALVVNMGPFDTNTLKVIAKIKAFSPNLSTIIIPTSIAKDALKESKKMKRVVVMSKPHSDTHLTLLCEKISRGDEIYQRNHERFQTQQPVILENLETQAHIPGIVHNMSKGGMFLEVSELLKMGDIYKLTIKLDKLDKTHSVFGEIRRVVKGAFGPGRNGIGVRFMEEEEAYIQFTEKSEI